MLTSSWGIALIPRVKVKMGVSSLIQILVPHSYSIVFHARGKCELCTT